MLFTFYYKTSYLNEVANCTEPSPSARVPCLGEQNKTWADFSTLEVAVFMPRICIDMKHNKLT
jgi:hypothetical protein